MSQAIRVALLLACVSSVHAEVPASWAPVGEQTYLVPHSVERFGNTIAFATVHKSGDAWAFTWRWAHCQRQWVTGAYAFGLSEQVDVSLAYRATAGERHSFAAPVDFQPLGSVLFADGSALRVQVRARCNSSVQSKGSTEVPVSASTKKDGTGRAYLLLLRSVARRGDIAEGWIRQRSTKEEAVYYSSGKPMLNPDGKPVVRTAFVEPAPEARFKVTADCKKGQIAQSRFIAYDEDGGVTYTDPADAKLSFAEPTPETVGETYLEVLCRL